MADVPINQPKPQAPTEVATQIAATLDQLFILTSDNRIFVIDKGAFPNGPRGWREIALPEAPA